MFVLDRPQKFGLRAGGDRACREPFPLELGATDGGAAQWDSGPFYLSSASLPWRYEFLFRDRASSWSTRALMKVFQSGNCDGFNEYLRHRERGVELRHSISCGLGRKR